MDIEGTYTLEAAPEDVWLSLMDSHLLEETVPGLERLERLEEPHFTVAMHIKQAPLSGAYQGQVTVSEYRFPTSYSLAFEGEGRQSAVNGTIALSLNEHGENTVVAYKCTLNLDKLRSTSPLPLPMIKGNIKHLFQQFFTAFADQLPTRYSIDMTETSQGIVLQTSSQQYDQMDFVSPSPSAAEQPPFLYDMVRRLHLGQGNPRREELWVNRIRRFGMISGLLLLVWLGTRLPRRRALRRSRS